MIVKMVYLATSLANPVRIHEGWRGFRCHWGKCASKRMEQNEQQSQAFINIINRSPFLERAGKPIDLFV
jgi:hypothetical protein